MRRKKTGYILLALLVITGLAGTISGSISGKERRIALNLMKNSKSDVLLSLKGLSEKQLDFKIAPDKWSAKECMYHIAVSENELWGWLQTALNAPANPEKRSEVKLTDEQLIQLMEDRSHKMKTNVSLEPQNTSYKSFDDAVNDFKKQRTKHIEYLRSTTEDLRDHIIKTPIGWVDCYQLCLMIASHSNRHMQQINETKEEASLSRIK
ncbi:MAG: DinB family protein [Bacteroidetes bacterium]|nr:DinB family protein [Bacteroidota bacterium]MBS1608552.1 DinB family protein [Bacteroidota bacterium]